MICFSLINFPVHQVARDCVGASKIEIAVSGIASAGMHKTACLGCVSKVSSYSIRIIRSAGLCIQNTGNLSRECHITANQDSTHLMAAYKRVSLTD